MYILSLWPSNQIEGQFLTIIWQDGVSVLVTLLDYLLDDILNFRVQKTANLFIEHVL